MNELHPVQGQPLAASVAQWLKQQEALGRFPLLHDAAGAIYMNQWCGVRGRWPEGGCFYLVTPAALGVCLATLGRPCYTPNDLSAALFDLVRARLMRQKLEKHRLPGLSRRVALFCMDGDILRHLPVAAPVAGSVLAGSPQ